MIYTRRELAKLALTVLPAARLVEPSTVLGAVVQAKPNSKVKGVQIGLNVPYSLGGRNMEADLLLKNCIQLGVSGLELRSQPVETFMGAPADADRWPRSRSCRDRRSQQVAAAARRWRRRATSARSTTTPACSIEIVKFDGIFAFTDPGAGLRVRARQGAGRTRDLNRDRRGRTEAPRGVRRQAQDDGRLPRARGDGPRGLGEGVRLRDAQRREPGHRPFRRRQPRLAGSVPQGSTTIASRTST